jgi:hypothetical protein
VKRERRSRRLVAVTALASSLVAFAASQSTAMGSPSGAQQSAVRTATVAVVMTREFRVAIVATRSSGASPPTAEVRVGLARRVGAGWREPGEKRLGETNFWNTVSLLDELSAEQRPPWTLVDARWTPNDRSPASGGNTSGG